MAFAPSGAVQKQKPPDGGLLNEIRQPHLWEQRKIPTGDVCGSDHGGQCRFFRKFVNGKSHAR
jgi:hypothetical protein